jgi:UMF1 family MFS transporter
MLEKGNKRVINAWAFYDWANSAYPLVITTAIFPMYYEAVTSEKDASGKIISDFVEFFGMSFRNTELYSYVISFSFVIVSVLSPLLSGVADYSDNKKQFLKFFCYLGALACASLFFFDVERLELSMLSVLVASVGFWASVVFYNAYLPEIAVPEMHDKISAKGYALGYIGSSILLIGCLISIMVFDVPAKFSFLAVAVWWVGFSQITYARLPERTYVDKPKENKFTKGWREIKKVWNQVKELKTLKRYLLSFFVYSMGVQTVMLMATLFAAKEINWGEDGAAKTGLIVSVLIIQFIAIAGAYLFSALSKKFGNIAALSVALVIWIGICVAAYFIHEPIEFYAVAGVVGLVMGGIQSLSRSTYSKLLPETKDHASFFSFYDVLEKIGIVVGTFSYALIEGLTGSMRNSIFALATFFVIGMLLLLRVPKNKSIQVK